LTFAYLLDLAHQSESNFTLVLRCCGLQLNRPSGNDADYVTSAVQHYRSIEDMRKETYDASRTCWTVLSENSAETVTDAILLDTKEHAGRMSIVLRSSLPYNQKKYSEILKTYCELLLWSSKAVVGPPLFSYLTQPGPMETVVVQHGIEARPCINPLAYGIPGWIDHTYSFGPRCSTVAAPYLIAFGVLVMIRPLVNTTYMELFMDGLISVVRKHFLLPLSNEDKKEQYSAIIVVLVSGSSLDEIATLRNFLESKYAKAIEYGMIKLVDSPLESYTSLQSMRITFPEDSHERRYWRSKQNLDIGALLNGTLGLSDYVLLLEDDYEFQPEFGNKMKEMLLHDASLPYPGILPAQSNFGFGYSGVLLHGTDTSTYMHFHITFFDEKPNDHLRIWQFIGKGNFVQVTSPPELGYGRNLYIRHFGGTSSLPGKIQYEIW
jgi:N-Acetylglucosaminyltransferase-IV (GnT-IV) conserved region